MYLRFFLCAKEFYIPFLPNEPKAYRENYKIMDEYFEDDAPECILHICKTDVVD